MPAQALQGASHRKAPGLGLEIHLGVGLLVEPGKSGRPEAVQQIGEVNLVGRLNDPAARLELHQHIVVGVQARAAGEGLEIRLVHNQGREQVGGLVDADAPEVAGNLGRPQPGA